MTKLILRCFCMLALACIHMQVFAASYFSISPQCTIQVQPIQFVKTDSIQHVPKTGWKTVDLPDNWSQHEPQYNGGVWYRILWKPDCSSGTLNQSFAFSIDYINSAGAVYFNRNVLWRDKNLVEPLSKSWNIPRYWVLTPSSLKAGENEFLIYVTGYAFQNAGLGAVSFQNVQAAYDQQQQQIWNRRTLFEINIIISLVLGLLCFSIWIFRRSETTFAWFALSCLLWVLFISNILVTETKPFANNILAAQANISFFALYMVCFCTYLLRFIRVELIKVERIVWAITAIVLLVIFFTPVQWLTAVFINIFMMYVALFLLTYIYLGYVTYRTRKREYIFLLMCLTGILFCALFDTVLLGSELHKDIKPLSPYTSPIITIFVVLILGVKLARNTRRIEKFNQRLEEKVQQVSDDLYSSMNEKHKLELENVRLQERIHLSHDLHDGLGSSLVRSMIIVDQAEQNMSNQQFLSILKLLRDDLRQIIDSGSSLESRVPENPILWVAPVRHRFSQLMEELDIESKWSFPQNWGYIPTALQCLTLIRVLEESLTNVVKHSQAKHVYVSMVFPYERQLILTIEDDGVGFDVKSNFQNGMSIGIRSMKMRLERVGAELQVTSERGKTVVQALLEIK